MDSSLSNPTSVTSGSLDIPYKPNLQCRNKVSRDIAFMVVSSIFVLGTCTCSIVRPRGLYNCMCHNVGITQTRGQ